MKITVVRHGETDYNKQRKIMGGDVDVPLNDRGREQAQKTAESLVGDFDVIVSSPMKRAEETANTIAKHLDLPVKTDERIRERLFGSLAGHKREEVNEIMGIDSKAVDRAQQYDYRAYGGESVEDVQDRLRDFIEDMKQEYTDEKVLVVAHGGIIRLLYHLYSDEEVTHLPNASVHEFEL